MNGDDRPLLPWGDPDGFAADHLDRYLRANPIPTPAIDVDAILTGIRRAAVDTRRAIGPLPLEVHVAPDVVRELRLAASRAVDHAGDGAARVWGLPVVVSPLVAPGSFVLLPRRAIADALAVVVRSAAQTFARFRHVFAHLAVEEHTPARSAMHTAYRAKTRRRNRRRSR